MSSNEENGKSEKRLMSIGEVSKAIGITRRIILNYEAKGLLLPDKKEGTAGNRYYTPDSISLIRSIRVLQNLGLSLDEISSYYNGSTDLEPLIERLEAYCVPGCFRDTVSYPPRPDSVLPQGGF